MKEYPKSDSITSANDVKEDNRNDLEKKSNNNEKPTLKDSSKHATKALFYSILKSYGMIPINLILTYVISRTISPEVWGILLYSLVLISISSLILVFFPPYIEAVIYYKIPELIVQNQKGKVQSLMIYAFKYRLGFSFIVFVGYLIVCSFLYQYSPLNGLILLLYTPLIILNQVRTFLNYFLNAIKEFKINMISYIAEKIILLFAYLILFFASFQTPLNIIIIALLPTITIIIAMAMQIVVYKKFFKSTIKENFNKQDMKNSFSFASNFLYMDLINGVFEQIYAGLINNIGNPKYNTYYNICKNSTTETINAFSIPINAMLTDLEKTNQHSKMLFLFNNIFNFSSTIVCLFIGIIFFFIRIYILVLYPPVYLEAIPSVQPFSFLIFFIFLLGNYHNLFIVMEKQREMVRVETINVLILISFAVIGVYVASFFGIILSRILGFSISCVIYWIYANKKVKLLNTNIVFYFRNIIAVFLIIIAINSIGIYNLLSKDDVKIIMDLLNFIQRIYPDIYDYEIQFISILSSLIEISVFCVLYAIYIILFRILTKNDLLNLEKLNLKIPGKKYLFKILNKILLTKKNIEVDNIGL